ncbi:Aspartate aminotransferase (EC 2.6.1.1) [uncultured Gammaproteobacteria bacterium]|jgi:aspartate aminotransferase|uniref:pyridoxal phosphate-dependent aminotransferase n=1 Tax=thiotrophic endosymbiont of Bathymodiolus puteoserpentis (Logatchev) TaxID=343240 RepID=UPI0010BB7BD1|nr:pyridoxal phosphate-dependent aminotransferase [thiotrophic endosymbiont of Bathymodiolus puteoserpentis (Logatchev)]CAC9572449.1 Aspartate aminotransferase (EC 2.6.1.1) [uncultured Gammaproteobacteria bacterium]CAC9594783.1 Aspartate aminotransferase (EC 2.6.1.1) [uncultured Gammaproteobacteria bacterium]CAC9599184.1 Aspartate aminotransferase (EC 2.6.1.1) [uncultured Gammaproteobacteria bacterium]CAC9654404.1 Aspartate aminotransferase (EC 2.6.1.1) [uncultured Gammaproteobacteria bacterium
MSNQLSSRVQKVKPSATLAVTAKANELKDQGIQIVPMGSGEPDFDTPINIQQAGINAIKSGQTRYTAVDGTPALKNAIISKFKRENALDYTTAEVMVSSGGKQVFYNLCQGVLDAGDEVIIPSPYWVSYPDMVILADATPVIVETGLEQDFKITPKQLENSITEKTKLFVINSPSNPTGAVYSKAELQALATVLKKYPQILIITDDIYEHIRWDDDNFINIVMVDNDLKERTIILNGVSKAYAMTGWRIGYGAGPETIIKAMKKIQGQSTSNPCSIAQAAALEALNGDQSIINTMVSAFEERHDFIVDALNAIDGIQCPKSQGAFYSFPRVEGLIKRLGLKDDVELSTYCLEKLNIALVPGSAFGAPGYVRFSFATSMDNIKQAVKRLSEL